MRYWQSDADTSVIVELESYMPETVIHNIINYGTYIKLTIVKVTFKNIFLHIMLPLCFYYLPAS